MGVRDKIKVVMACLLFGAWLAFLVSSLVMVFVSLSWALKLSLIGVLGLTVGAYWALVHVFFPYPKSPKNED